MKTLRGFTLIELMITLVIAGIIMAVAVPSFKSVITSNRFTTQANEFVTAMNMARSEAIKRGADVRVIATGGNWANGWEVQDAANTKLLVAEALTGGNTMVSTNSLTTFTYKSSGFVSATDTIKICKTTGEAGREITVSLTGRVSAAKQTC